MQLSLIPCLTRLDIAGQYVTVGMGTDIMRAFVLWFKCILSFLVCLVAKMIVFKYFGFILYNGSVCVCVCVVCVCVCVCV